MLGMAPKQTNIRTPAGGEIFSMGRGASLDLTQLPCMDPIYHHINPQYTAPLNPNPKGERSSGTITSPHRTPDTSCPQAVALFLVSVCSSALSICHHHL